MAALVAALALLLAGPVAPAVADTTPPGPPLGIFVVQGESWQTSSVFDIWWHNPADHETPIAVAHYELCPAVPLGPCTTDQAAGEGISEMTVVLPYFGWFWLRLWLEDAEGKFDPNAKSQAVMLRYDAEEPPMAFFRHDDKWLGADTPLNPSFLIEIDANGPRPVSGIRGYSLTLDGTPPNATVDAFAVQDYESYQSEHALLALAEGVTDVRVRSVSNSGVGSDEIGTGRIRLDRTPPTVDASGLPDPAIWQSKAVALTLTGADQAHLSGIDPAPPEHHVEDGGHLAYTLDDGPTQRFRGGQAELSIAADGRHEVRYQAFDAAGNGSAEKVAEMKIDRTAPTGAFEALDPADPRALKVRVSDATSGVAGGHIEYRPEGVGGFTRLPTLLDGSRLSARLDDVVLPRGRYELRAVVRDVAGNEAIVTRRADGSPMVLGLPLRADARVEAATRVVVKRCVAIERRAKRRRRAARRKGAKPRKRCVKRTTTVAGSSPAKLAHGQRATVVGQVATAQGMPLAGAGVTVEAQLRSGGPPVTLGSATTDALGNFRFAVAAGPSRTVRLRFGGSDTVRPAVAELTTTTPAAARLAVNRRRLRNGQAVRFTGRLRGDPIPADGKLVALQAKVGRRWRTFATPRASADGVFKYRYRFTSTTGLRRYAFRAVVTREAAYPYERGVSRIVRVTVRGR